MPMNMLTVYTAMIDSRSTMRCDLGCSSVARMLCLHALASTCYANGILPFSPLHSLTYLRGSMCADLKTDAPVELR